MNTMILVNLVLERIIMVVITENHIIFGQKYVMVITIFVQHHKII